MLSVGLALVVAGCGDDDDDATSLTKDGFIAEADAICAAGDEEINAAGEQLGQTPQGQELIDFAEDVVIPSIQTQHDEIAALPVPEGEEEEVDELLTALQQAIDDLEQDPAQIAEGNAAESFQEVNQLAEDFGLTNCGGDS